MSDAAHATRAPSKLLEERVEILESVSRPPDRFWVTRSPMDEIPDKRGKFMSLKVRVNKPLRTNILVFSCFLAQCANYECLGIKL